MQQIRRDTGECNITYNHHQELLLCVRKCHVSHNKTGLSPEPNLLCKEEIKKFPESMICYAMTKYQLKINRADSHWPGISSDSLWCKSKHDILQNFRYIYMCLG